MKRLTIAMVAACLSMAAWAQDFTLTIGTKGNSGGYMPTKLWVDKAPTEGHYYSAEPDLNAFSKIKGIVVREVDMDYREVRSVAVPNSKGFDIMHSQLNGGQMHLVLGSYEKKHIALRHVCVDLSSFSIVADSLLMEKDFEKNEQYYHWESLSASGNHYAIVYATANEKKGTAEVQAMLFDRDMRCQWAMPLQVSAISQVFATDDGRVATVGVVNGENKADGAMVEFSISNGVGTQSGRHSSAYNLGEVALLNVFGNKVLATVLETDCGTGWAGSFQVGSVITTGTVYTGIAAYLFDVAEGKTAYTDRHAFTKADVRVFYNASLISEVLSPDVNFLSLRAKASTTDGGAALYGRTWMEKVVNTKNGMSQSTYYYKGMMLVRADSTGHIAWVRPLMHDNGNNGDFAENAETDMVAEGNNLYVLTNESPKDPDTYDPDNALRRTVLKVHGAVVVYRFDPDGNVIKKKLKTEGTNIICTPLRRQSPGHYTFVVRSNKGYIADLTIN